MELTIGPNQFFWQADIWREFNRNMAADAPVDRMVLGELVCSKRLPFYQNHIPEAVEQVQASGKAVSLTSLALVTLKRERNLTADLGEMFRRIHRAKLGIAQPMAHGKLTRAV